MENEKKPIIKEEELYAIAKKIIFSWKKIIKITSVFLIFGIIIAFSNRKEYTAEVSMAPESGESSSFGSIGSLASIAGLDLGSLGGNGDALYPLLYPDIVYSTPFIISLLDVPIQTVDGCIDSTYLYYRTSIQKKSWLKNIVSLPKKGAKCFFSLFTKKLYWGGDSTVFNPYYLSDKQFNFIESIKKDVSILIDKKTDVIYLSFTAQDPKVAAIMVDEMRIKLQDAITKYRTNKSESDFTYIEKLYLEAKNDYEYAQIAYADFCDKNRNVSSEMFLIEKDRLAVEKDLKNTIYEQLAQQLQLSKAKIQQNTPAFTTLKPAAIPTLPSSTRKITTIFLFTFLGMIFSFSYVAFKESIMGIIGKILKPE